jgi:hypothetical protein
MANQPQVATVALVLGGDTTAAAGSLLTAATCLSASAPADTPGMVLLANQPQVAAVTLILDRDIIAAAGSPSAAATCLSASTPTNTLRMDPLENPPLVLANPNTTCAVGYSSDCSDGHVGLFAQAAILAATVLPAVTNPSWTLPAIVAAATQGGRTLPAVTIPSQTLPVIVAATTQSGWIGGAGSVAVGGPLAAGGASGANSIAMAGRGDPAERA